MSLQVNEIPIPEPNLSPEKAVDYLVEFLRWTSHFFDRVAEHATSDDEFRIMLAPHFPKLVLPALRELRAFEAFERCEYHMAAERNRESYIDSTIIPHGLSGAQLNLKYYNVKYWLDRFLIEKIEKLFKAFLSALNSLLKSMLSEAPGGGAIIEFKEMIENAVREVSEEG